MRSSMVAAGLMAASLLAGCGGSGYQYRYGAGQTIGALGGAAAGGYIGSQIGQEGDEEQLAATAIGALLGAFIGSEIGRSLDQQSRQQHAYAMNQAFQTGPTGTTTQWQNPQAGTQGVVQAGPVYNTSGRVCRNYQQTIYVGGQAQSATGVACRNADGSWSIVS